MEVEHPTQKATGVIADAATTASHPPVAAVWVERLTRQQQQRQQQAALTDG